MLETRGIAPIFDSCFEFVSNFVLRISNLSMARPPPCSCIAGRARLLPLRPVAGTAPQPIAAPARSDLARWRKRFRSGRWQRRLEDFAPLASFARAGGDDRGPGGASPPGRASGDA